MSQLISEKWVRARKRHSCRTCLAVAIHPGEVYLRSAYVHDGMAFTWIQCKLCESMRSDVFDWSTYADEGIGLEDYAEWAREHVGTDARAAEWLSRSGSQ